MPLVLVALDDPALRDQIQAVFRMFPEVQAITVERDQVPELLRDPDLADAVIVNREKARSGHDPFISNIRSHNRKVKILAVAERPHRERFSRTKLELDVFSFIPLPLDAFDLLRRVHRLVETLHTA